MTQTDQTPPPSSKPRPRRRHRASRSRSARDLLRPTQFQESLLLAPPPSIQNTAIAGLQAAITVLIALTTIHFSPWAHMVGFPALGALAALFGRFASMRRRRSIVSISAALFVAAVFVPSLISYAGASLSVMIAVLAVAAGLATMAVSHWRLGGPGATLFVFAVGAVLGGPAETWLTVVERTLATAWGAGLAIVVCIATDRLRAQPVSTAAAPAPHSPPLRSQLIAACRITAGAGAAAYIAHAVGWHYPAWATIGATAVMQGSHLHITMNRALQRMAGTVLGACIAWAVLAQSPSFWWVLVAIVLFQFITEIIISYNYALGQATITPMALLMTHLAAPVADSNMPVERVLDTIVGAAIGIVFAVAFSTADDRVYLNRRRNKLEARR
ncbi:FUSC family protein [Pusillimonas noertemannii]|uniref:FUSC family protein n=1 Tax=Pusillimonas noertemannii TaxID=305977 RepID=UPI00030CB0B7|nr:FUSC family protein [Pusillimonas noertemannii]